MAKLEPGDYFQVGTEEPQALRVYLRYALFRALDDFALRNTSQDQIGLLLGEYSKENNWVKAEEAVEVKTVEGELSDQSWQTARTTAAERYPGLQVVGWFHSHPGAGVAIQPLARDVHGKFFGEPWQVVYVMDPVLRERGFYAWQNGRLSFDSGFRIYGKEEKVSNMAEREPSRPDEHLRERYLERSVEKLHKLVRRPAVRPVDYAGLGLLVLLIALVLMRPSPAVKVDQAELLSNQQKMSEQLTKVSERLRKVEEHLTAVGMLDAQLDLPNAVAPSETPSQNTDASPSATPEAAVSATASPAASPSAASIGGVKVGSKVRLHKVSSGDTLSTICQKYYNDPGPRVSKALGKYNKLKGPYYDIFENEVLKIPERSALGV